MEYPEDEKSVASSEGFESPQEPKEEMENQSFDYEDVGVEVEQNFDEDQDLPNGSPFERSPTRVYATDKPDEELATIPLDDPYEESSHMHITNIIEEDDNKNNEKNSCLGCMYRCRIPLMIIICVLILLIVLTVVIGVDFSKGKNTESNSAGSKEGGSLAPTPTPVLELQDYTLNAIEKDSNSPQARAYQWYLEDVSSKSYSSERMLQRFCLATLYYATQGDNWTDKTEWLTESHECNWFSSASRPDYPHGWATACAANSDDITQLILSDNNLNTTMLPEELYLLTNLVHLDLQSNSLRGAISSQIGNLNKLQRLRLNRNRMTGSLPSELEALSSLEVLSLYNNQFTSLGSSLAPSLTQLWISNNRFNGSLPSALGLLSQLQILWMDQNRFSGQIPGSEIMALSNLQDIMLYENELTGSLPSQFGMLTALTSLDVRSNGINGTIPSHLGMLTNLETLILHQNALTGSMPSEVGLLTKLQNLYVSANGINGTIPIELGNLEALKVLWLNNNELQGPIPSEMGLMTNILTLALQGNPELSGNIPSEFAGLTTLAKLTVGRTSLTGEIPEDVCTSLGDALEYECSATFCGCGSCVCPA